MSSVLKAVADAEANGQTFFATWRKTPSQTTQANVWFDFASASGNPVPNYYIGPALTFTPLAQSTHGGILHGQPVSPATKFLRIFEAQTSGSGATNCALNLLDYLGFYPFIDESDLSEQVLDNTLPVPRYPDGENVQMMPVVTNAQVGGQSFTVRYTNSDGVADRLTPPHVMSGQNSSGTILTSAGANVNARGTPFMTLQPGDTGVRSVQGVTVLGSGDVGLFALVLVRPIATHSIRGIDAPSEQDYLMSSSQLPIIKDDAYLNAIANPSSNMSTNNIHGYIKTLWT